MFISFLFDLTGRSRTAATLIRKIISATKTRRHEEEYKPKVTLSVLTCKKGLCYLFCIKIQYDACYMRDAMVNFC